MSSHSFNIIYKEGQGEIVEKKSRFIANIFPIETEEDALEKIAQIRKKHYDARHNCFAYVIGDKNETERCSDDGEPSGTAGRPMLEVLTGAGVHNAVAIVTRYFGGTLLGTGGLVRAYTGAMKAGLEACVIMEQHRGYRIQIITDYNDMGKIQYLARTMELTELDMVYSDGVEIYLLVPEDAADRFEADVVEKTAGKAKIDRQDEVRYGVVDGKVVIF